MPYGMPLLSSLIWLPIIGGALLLLMKPCARWSIGTATLISMLSLITLIFVWFNFAPDGSLQYVERRQWLSFCNAEYYLALDGYSLSLSLLTALIMPLVFWQASERIHHQLTRYVAAFMILQGLMYGVFLSWDALLFYFFWEAMLIPMFLIIGLYGGRNRRYASIKFFLYTFLGSIFLLIALLYLQAQTNQFDLQSFHKLALSTHTQQWLFWALLAGFAVKIPMVPVHTWLPDAHTEAPTGGSVVLAAVLLKMGGYGFIRFILPVTPDACYQAAPILCLASLLAIVYIGVVAISQHDMKRLIAYSSISHMGFVTLGFFIPFMPALNNALEFDAVASLGFEGAMVQMISHGFISSGLFFAIGVLYERHHTRLIQDYGGMAQILPKFAAFFLFFALANTGLPGTSGFVGELFVILATLRWSLIAGLLAASTLVLSAVYTLWLYKRVMYGQLNHPGLAHMKDLTRTESMTFVILAVLVLGLGLKPGFLLEKLHPTTEILIQMIQAKQLDKGEGL